MQERREKDEYDAMLVEYCPHCRENKMNCICKYVESMDSQPRPTMFKVINKNGEVLYISQQRPWTQRQGMPQDPLQNYNRNNQWKNYQKIDFNGNINWQKPQQGWQQPQQGW